MEPESSKRNRPNTGTPGSEAESSKRPRLEGPSTEARATDDGDPTMICDYRGSGSLRAGFGPSEPTTHSTLNPFGRLLPDDIREQAEQGQEFHFDFNDRLINRELKRIAETMIIKKIKYVYFRNERYIPESEEDESICWKYQMKIGHASRWVFIPICGVDNPKFETFKVQVPKFLDDGSANINHPDYPKHPGFLM